MGTPDKSFKIRTYGFSELAQCYNPEINKESAANQLRRWIGSSTDLLQKLADAGYSKGNKILTPKQVKILVEHLGEP